MDAADPFPVVLRRFRLWLSTHVEDPCSICFASDGPWDLRDFMQKQCLTSNLPFPPYMQRFLDLRHIWTKKLERPKANLLGMLTALGFKFQGREHSGIADARNIARILVWMLARHGEVVMDVRNHKHIHVSKNVARIRRLLRGYRRP